MWIKAFSWYIASEQLEQHILKDTRVVIDGQNFFYNTYKECGAQFEAGCESDKYAKHIKSHLNVFKKANIKCYFLFKGGHEDPSKIRKTSYKIPIFVRDIYKRVLDEMGFDYAICEFESKRECIALAQKLNCPIVSNDIEFCFSGVPYIPYPTFDYDEKLNVLRCKLFTLNNFMRKYGITKENLAIFVVLNDQNLFPENYFFKFFKSLRTPFDPVRKIDYLIKWLSGLSAKKVLERIFKYTPQLDQSEFLEKFEAIKAMICRSETPDLPSLYLENRDNVSITKGDPRWFTKGVLTNHIAISYINLYKWKLIHGSWMGSNGVGEALSITFEIIKYAFNLLTNYKESEFMVWSDNFDNTMVVTGHFTKPKYEAIVSPFENGWSEVRSLQLFEHFLMESLQGFDFSTLKTLPEDAQLLMIALVYFSRKKSDDTSAEVCSVLLSYVALNIILLDPTTDNNNIEYIDKLNATPLLLDYFDKPSKEDRLKLHTLVEFQHCLDELNNLNHLCGRPFLPTDYSKTFNGAFVYNVLDACDNSAFHYMGFFENMLNPAPTVLAYFKDLFRVYHKIVEN